MENNILEWISQWYNSNCDGDWEHHFGMNIETIDNPGWSIEIDTTDTSTVLSNKLWKLEEVSTNNWYGYEIKGGQFRASGDLNKLEFLLNIFKNLIKSKL